MGGLFRFLLWAGLLCGLVVGSARLLVLRWLWIPENDPVLTTSIMPSLVAGDLVIVQRVTPTEFGDLVLCPEPSYPSRYVIGRILGVPGDVVRIKNGTPLVNEKGFEFERLCNPHTLKYPHPTQSSAEVTQLCYYEALASQKVHKVGQVGDQKTGFGPSERSYEVPEGHFFLVSDNRLFPYDSRDYGVVPITSCKETVALRLVSKRGWSDVAQRMTIIQ
jgi:signal peptidase I